MIKNGVFVSDYAGIHDPRFSFNGVDVVKPEDETVPQNPTASAPIEQTAEPSKTTFDIDDIVPEDPGDDYYNKTQTGRAKSTVTKEKVIKRLQRIFGKNIAVEVVENIYDMNGKLLPGVVGRLYSDVIRICERAAEGTEFHEAFHRVSLLLLPKSM